VLNDVHKKYQKYPSLSVELENDAEHSLEKLSKDENK
jgi:hypothetical protein